MYFYRGCQNKSKKGEIKMKLLQEKMMAVFDRILANCAFEIAKISGNSICWLPFYEPEQPKELEKLKKEN